MLDASVRLFVALAFVGTVLLPVASESVRSHRAKSTPPSGTVRAEAQEVGRRIVLDWRGYRRKRGTSLDSR